MKNSFCLSLGTALFVFCAVSSTVFAADDFQSAFREGKASGEIRTFAFQRDFENKQDWEDVAMGGMFYYNTAPVKGLSAGIAFFTGQDIGSDDDKAVYGLLAKDDNGNHESYTALSHYYLQGDWYDTRIRVGAQPVKTPWLSGYDIRLTPLSFKGVGIINKSIPNTVITGYHLTGMKGWSSRKFKDFTQTPPFVPFAGVTEQNPLSIFGLEWSSDTGSQNILWSQLKAGFWDYHLKDTLNFYEVSIDVIKNIGNYTMTLSPRFVQQQDIGDSILGDIDTYQAGGILSFKHKSSGLFGNVRYSTIGDDPVRSFLGLGSVIVMKTIICGDHGGDKGAAVKLGYNFSDLGLSGLTAFADYADIDGEEVDRSELDLQVEYIFSGTLDGWGVKVSHAVIESDDGDYTDSRFCLSYKFDLGLS